MRSKRIKCAAKVNTPVARALIARWLRRVRAQGIRVERVHSACFYLVRNNEGRGLASHFWDYAGNLRSEQIA